MSIQVSLSIKDGTRNITVNLPSYALSAMVDSLANYEGWSELCELMATHPDHAVRKSVAKYSELSDSAIRMLVPDSSMAVVKELLKSRNSRQRFNEAEVQAICQRDPELAEYVAAKYEDFEFENDTVIETLSMHPDSSVRSSLAANPFVPKSILRRLADNDSDEGVRDSARQNLS